MNSSSTKQICFSFLLLFSGLCGISYEIIYGRILADLIGDQFIVSASILLTFLLGIGFGTLFAYRFGKYLWLIEGIIGLYGILFASSSGLIENMLYHQLSFVSGNIYASLLCAMLLLSFPAFLIGTSLPIFANYATQLRTSTTFSWTYAIYNFGAALTVLLIEFWFIRAFGITQTMWIIACCNCLVALTLFFAYPELRKDYSVINSPKAVTGLLPKNAWVALIIASIGSAIFQLLMVKLAECILGPFRETFALVLCWVLLGIALGSYLIKKTQWSFKQVLLLNLIGLAWLCGGFELTALCYAYCYPVASNFYFTNLVLKFALLGAFMFLPAITFGATIPSLLQSNRNIAQDSGRLLFASCMANAFGFFLMAALLHRYFDYGILILIVTGLVFSAYVVYTKQFTRSTLVALSVFLTTLGLHRFSWDEDNLFLGHTSFHSLKNYNEEKDQYTFAEKFKGPQDIFSIVWYDEQPYFFINGYFSIPLDSAYEKIVGAVSAIFAPRNDQALVLGVGSGATASSVGLLFDRTDAVEINKVVLDNLFRMKDYNFDIESNDKVNIIHDDGVHFVKAATEQYSLIINTVTTPLYFSSSKLYTQDFVESIKRILTNDGIYVTWIDSRIGEAGVDIILKTLSETFSHCGIVSMTSSYFLLVCSESPITAHQPEIVARNSVLGNYLFRNHGIMPEWMQYSLLTTNAQKLVPHSDVPLNTLNRPTLEFEMASLNYKRGYNDFRERLVKSLNFSELDAAFGGSENWNPAYLVSHSQERLGESDITKTWQAQAKAAHPDIEEAIIQADLKYTWKKNTHLPKFDQYHKIGYKLMRKKLYSRAIKAFEKTLQLNPKRNNTHFNLGACYEYQEDYTQALEHYQKELAIDPSDEDAEYRIGRTLVKLQNHAQSIPHLEQAISQSKEPNAYYYLAQAHEGLGNISKAYAYYSDVLEHDEEHLRAMAALERLNPILERSK